MKILSFRYSPIDTPQLQFPYDVYVHRMSAEFQNIYGLVLSKLTRGEINALMENPEEVVRNRDVCAKAFRTFKAERMSDIKITTL